MTGHEYREAIERLELSQVGAARFLGVAETTSRRWIAEVHPIPPTVEMLLQVMLSYKLSPNSVQSLMKKKKRA